MCIKNAIFCKKRWSVRIRGRHLDIPIPMCTALYSTARYSFFPIFRKEKFEYRTLFAVFLLGIQRVRQLYFRRVLQLHHTVSFGPIDLK